MHIVYEPLQCSSWLGGVATYADSRQKHTSKVQLAVIHVFLYGLKTSAISQGLTPCQPPPDAPHLAKLGRRRPAFGQHRLSFGQIWADIARIDVWPTSAGLGLHTTKG